VTARSTTTAAPPAPAPQPAARGLHPLEWACEAAGVFAFLLVGTFAVVAGFAPASPFAEHVHDLGWRLLAVGCVFPATGSLLALTPAGKLSGAHFNPAVSLAFFLQHHLRWPDLLGFVGAQCVGAVAAAELAACLAPGLVRPAPVHDAITAPRPDLGVATAGLIEAAMTMGVVLLIFFMVSSPRTARLTPFVVWPAITLLVWQVAPFTGTSLNPARSLGPDVAAGVWPGFAAYVVGPLGGAMLASLVWDTIRSRSTLTAKLFHDERYRSVLRTELPAHPAQASPRPGGE
jgi:aquaporin Z